jgi:hypothetical protein
MKHLFLLSLLLALALLPACQSSSSSGSDDDTDAGADSDSDTDTNRDTDNETDTDSSTDPGFLSHIWIANTGEGTLSKIDTVEAVEVARYVTGPAGTGNDPSRTSVNLHGDMVVSNRNPLSGPSSVTKFLGDVSECYDKNDNDAIDTSSGPTDVLPWDEDECMMWHTPLGSSVPLGARATAWDGLEDPESGLGGHVWIGTCPVHDPLEEQGAEQKVYKLDGEWGDILEEVWVPVSCAYGGAVDGQGGFWIFDQTMHMKIARVDMETLETFTHEVSCGYGITVDAQGRVWTGGHAEIESTDIANCVNRYDPTTDEDLWISATGADFLRGIAVGTEMSAGSVWAADTSGTLFEIDEESVEVLGQWPVGASSMIGVAVDHGGYVWTVSRIGNEAYKFNPETDTHVAVPVGQNPYTYSDMTGVQLKNVTPVE